MINKTGLRFSALCVLFFCVILNGVQAQESTDKKTKKEKQAEKREKIDKMIRQEEEGALIYQKQSIFGGKIYSDGWAAIFEKGYMKTVDKTNLFSIEIGERKDWKEQRISKTVSGTPYIGNSLVYGKQNNFLFLKLGVGQSYLIGGKGNRNGVAVSAVYNGGISLGFMKPYYLKVTDPNTFEEREIKYNGDNSYTDSLFLDPVAINGGAGFFKGFNELKLKPGLFAKGALRFDYGRYNELISAIETGFNLEYYFSDTNIMVNNPGKKLYANVFLGIEFGKRK